MSMSILETKLYIPTLRSELVSRPRLLERFNRAIRSDCKLVLVSAPAGFGKTTLVSEWVHHACIPTAWLSLDESDNDPCRFWSYLVAALHKVHPGVGDAISAMAQSRPFSCAESLLTDLINKMTARTDPFVLVLDDLYLINEQQLHSGLVFLVENLPSRMHIVVCSRADPPWPLARLRARDNLIELRSSDLRFRPDEVAAFIQTIRIGLSDEAIATLGARTEGWIAGLKMAVLSMRGQNGEQTAAFLRTFSGSHRFILDYLMEEVLDRQPASTQDFLLKTSILDRLTASLCDAVMGGSGQDAFSPHQDSQQVLTQVERANLFLVPLDDERRWYRYHHLFAELLRSRLQQTWPDQVPALHLLASKWYEKTGLIAEAVRHALDASDTERVVHLVERNVLAMIEEGTIRSVVRWLDMLSDEMVHNRPWLSVARAWTLANAGRFDLVEPLLQIAEERVEGQDERQHLTGHIAVVRAYVASSTGDLSRAARCARAALDILSDEDEMLRGYLYSLLSVALRWSGELDAASRVSFNAIALSRESGDLRILTSVLCDCAALRIVQGQFSEAEALCREALGLAGEYLKQSGWPLPVSGRAHELLGGVLYVWDDLPGAVYHARQGVVLCERWGQPDFLASAYCRLARVLHATGDVAGAMEAIQKATRTANQVSLSYGEHMAAWEARLWLAQGNTARAVRWARESGLRVDDEFEFERLFRYECLARVLVARGRDDPDCTARALLLLARLLAIAEQAGAAYLAVRLLVLQAAAWVESQPDRARAALVRALDMAGPQGYIRIFVEERAQLGGLLLPLLARRQRPQQTTRGEAVPGYVGRLLSALRAESAKVFPQTTPFQPSTLVEPLSERECEVLQLVAAGLSNREIAQSLVIALNTVKNHLKNIYGKLAVHSRTQAVERARNLDLL